MYKRRTKSDLEFIGIDWGSSNFRAYAVDAEGNVKQRTKAHQGIARIKDGNYVSTLKRLLGKWFNKYPETPVIMSGMIGSHEGWQEVDCVDCPAQLEDLANYVEKIVNHRFERDIYIVPGVRLVRNEQSIDFLRGEEVQALGAALCTAKAGKQVICLPGTQTKWVQVENGQIVNFISFVTGELYSLLSRQLQQNQMVTTNIYDPLAVQQGLKLLQEGNGILSDIFKIKMLLLNEKIQVSSVPSLLSALLVGSEIDSALKQLSPIKELTVVGASWLIELYQEICKGHGVTVSGIKSEDATVRGFLEISKGLYNEHNTGNTRASIKQAEMPGFGWK
jgi:2-dehydro-3-deoxygalactonokinase